LYYGKPYKITVSEYSEKINNSLKGVKNMVELE